MTSLVREPLLLFMAQVVVILAASRALGLVAKPLRQPLVVAEIVAGILLGPSCFGAIWPAGARALFAPDSLKVLGLVSQLGLVLFMFLVGLELDFKQLRGRARASIAISHASIVVPFALGGGAALVLHAHWAPAGVTLLPFALFLGIAMSVTAFPVLARILAEQKLSRSRLGVLAIACAAVDDVTAWCLLAFVVALAKSRGMLSAIGTAGLALVYIAAMVLIARPLLARWMARVAPRGELTQNLTAALFMLLLLSAMCTELIGIHALFGAFVLGAIVPKQHEVHARLSSRIEDVVVVVFLPLFFAFSGVRTQLGLLNTPVAWLVAATLCALACLGKFGGSAVAARLTGSSWREATALGVLMNTRGLMELIVLNLGLDLGILSPTLFTMLVLMALVTTFMTSPLLRWLRPHEAEVDAPAPVRVW